MASQGEKRHDFGAIQYLAYTTDIPDDDSNLTKPIHWRVTIEGGIVKLWIQGRRHGKTIYYGQELKDLRINI